MNRPTPHPRADKKRQQIINAAKKLFIKHGFNQVSMEKIAKEAGCNHSLIYHHFGDKTSLWRAVKTKLVQQSQEKKALMPSLQLPWTKFLRQLVDNQCQFYRSNKGIQRLLILQRIENKKPSTKEKDISESSKQWIDAIKHYQQQGDISLSLSPAYVSCFILSIVSGWALDHQPIIPDSSASCDYIELCCSVIIKGLV